MKKNRFAPRPGSDIRLLIVLALGGFGAATALLALLHVTPQGGGINPFTAMLSDYALCPGWWMWDLALVMTSIGSAVVLVALRRQHVLSGRPAPACMGIWCLSVLLVASFTKDPQGGAITVTGKAHLYATAVSCASLPIVGLTLGRRHRAHPQCQPFALWARRLALCSVPFFLPFIVPFAETVLLGHRILPMLPTGLLERLMAALDLGLLVLLGLWAWHTAPGGDRWDCPDFS